MLQSELMNRMRKGGLGTLGKAKLCQLSRACLTTRWDTPLIDPPWLPWRLTQRPDQFSICLRHLGNGLLGATPNYDAPPQGLPDHALRHHWIDARNLHHCRLEGRITFYRSMP